MRYIITRDGASVLCSAEAKKFLAVFEMEEEAEEFVADDPLKLGNLSFEAVDEAEMNYRLHVAIATGCKYVLPFYTSELLDDDGSLPLVGIKQVIAQAELN